MKTICVFDWHLCNINPVRIGEFELPLLSLQGSWEVKQVSEIISAINTEFRLKPVFVCSSPKQSDLEIVKMIGNQSKCWKKHQIQQYSQLFDMNSGLEGRSIIDFLQNKGVKDGEDFFLQPEVLRYLWKKSTLQLKLLRNLAKDMRNGQIIMLFSNDSQIEMRFLRLLLLMAKKEINLFNQSLDMIIPQNLVPYGGMLQSGDGFGYNMVMDKGMIFGVEKPRAIRLLETASPI